MVGTGAVESTAMDAAVVAVAVEVDLIGLELVCRRVAFGVVVQVKWAVLCHKIASAAAVEVVYANLKVKEAAAVESSFGCLAEDRMELC